MKYWPLSTLINSPLMPGPYALELNYLYERPLTQRSYNACIDVARHTPGLDTGLVVIESVDAPMHRAYVERPSCDEWARLERAGVLRSVAGTMFLTMDALH